jgi:hypothetical protein
MLLDNNKNYSSDVLDIYWHLSLKLIFWPFGN